MVHSSCRSSAPVLASAVLQSVPDAKALGADSWVTVAAGAPPVHLAGGREGTEGCRCCSQYLAPPPLVLSVVLGPSLCTMLEHCTIVRDTTCSKTNWLHGASLLPHHLTHLPPTKPIIGSQVLQDPSLSGWSHPSMVFCTCSQGVQAQQSDWCAKVQGRLLQPGWESRTPS